MREVPFDKINTIDFSEVTDIDVRGLQDGRREHVWHRARVVRDANSTPRGPAHSLAGGIMLLVPHLDDLTFQQVRAEVYRLAPSDSSTE